MQITQVDLWHVAIPTKTAFRPAWIPGFPQTENRCTLVRIRTRSGLEGYSAGASLGTERAGIGSLLGPYLLGERADDIPSIRQRIREMGYLGMRLGWLEPACWDILGKARGKPVYELLGGSGGKLKLYASTGEVKSGAQRAREVEARMSEGFEAVKLRVHDATLEQDLAQIRETRRAVGSKVELGVDANQGWRVAVVADAPKWGYERALAFCQGAEEEGFSWVEEPLAMDDYEGLAKLRANTQVNISGGELNNQGLPEFRVMLEKGCFDLYQPDACFTGGLAETWEIIQLIQQHSNARYTPHTWTNGIGFAINMHLHAASPWREETLLEYPYDPPSWDLAARDGLLKEPWEHQRGYLELPTTPGLGFEVDPKALRRYGRHFFKATRVRMAAYAVWDKGLKTAKELGSIRDARLARRSEEMEGVDAVELALGRVGGRKG